MGLLAQVLQSNGRQEPESRSDIESNNDIHIFVHGYTFAQVDMGDWCIECFIHLCRWYLF
jgi:hypothetical protein